MVGLDQDGLVPQTKQFFVSLPGGVPIIVSPKSNRPARETDVEQVELSVPKFGEPKE